MDKAINLRDPHAPLRMFAFEPNLQPLYTCTCACPGHPDKSLLISKAAMSLLLTHCSSHCNFIAADLAVCLC